MSKIQAKKLKFVNRNTLLVTVDMGKDSFSGYARCPDRSEVRSSDFTNNFREDLGVRVCILMLCHNAYSDTHYSHYPITSLTAKGGTDESGCNWNYHEKYGKVR